MVMPENFCLNNSPMVLLMAPSSEKTFTTSEVRLLGAGMLMTVTSSLLPALYPATEILLSLAGSKISNPSFCNRLSEDRSHNFWVLQGLLNAQKMRRLKRQVAVLAPQWW